ncbi:MAG: chromosomal replication initiator protein DnaA [Elusimicrobiota bacterium]
MQKKSSSTLWEQAVNLLKKDLPVETFDLWLQPIRPISFENGKLLLEVPNHFFSQWLKENYQQKIEEILTSETDQPVNINYQVIQSLDQILNKKDAYPDPLVSPQPESAFESSQLNPKYTFATFVVGPSNRFAQAAAEAVAKDPGRAYNPLFIYGGVGLGKTHLLHAVGHYIKQQKPKARVLYITSERFTNEMIDSLRHDRMPQFHNKYRSLDCLLIDDIQFLAKREGIQEIFFHTFNALYDTRKQIVVSSDATPKEIPTLEERLRSRFEWGVIADIQTPDLETRIAILRKKAEMENFFVPDDVILFIAGQIRSNIRELEGSLIRIVAFASLTGTEISVDRAKEILKDIITKDDLSAPITIENIQKIVSRYFHLEVKDLKGKKRPESIAFPRQIAMYLTRNLSEFSTTEIGEAFGGRDHTTVMYACEKIKHKLDTDPYFVALVNKLIKQIKSGDE